jgi:peptidoglycan hydrolase CwlO-like protein
MIARLRAEAVKIQTTIDRMNDQIQGLVEDYTTNEDALKATLADERRTRRRLEAAEAQLEEAQRTLDDRVRSIYITGTVTGLGQFLGVHDVHEALTAARREHDEARR